MITPSTRWLPLPGALGACWEGSDSGLVRRTAAPAGFEGFVGRLAMPQWSKGYAIYILRVKGGCRWLAVRTVFRLHDEQAGLPKLEWVERVRAFVADYNVRLEAGEEVERGYLEVPVVPHALGDSGQGDSGHHSGSGVPFVRETVGGRAASGDTPLDQEASADHRDGADADHAGDRGGAQAARGGPGGAGEEAGQKRRKDEFARLMAEAEALGLEVAAHVTLPKLRSAIKNHRARVAMHARHAQDVRDTALRYARRCQPAPWPATDGFSDREPEFGLGF